MGRRSLPATAGLLALSLAPFSASAADLLPPPAIVESGVPVVSELGSGWYLRGDIGGLEYIDPKEERYGARTATRSKPKLDSTFSLGGGFGYKFNSWFRSDVTIDWRQRAQYGATSRFTRPTVPPTAGTTNHSGDLETTTGLFNLYVDLGAWSGFTPYVGAGVGASHNRLENFLRQDYCNVGCNAFGARLPTPANDKLNFAWAVMAGVAVDVGAGFKLDLGYRYVNLGEAQTKIDRFGLGYAFKDLDAHEARVGFRYVID